MYIFQIAKKRTYFLGKYDCWPDCSDPTVRRAYGYCIVEGNAAINIPLKIVKQWGSMYV